MTTCVSQQTPSSAGSHVFSTGVHWENWKMASRPMMMLRLMMVIHKNQVCQRLTTRDNRVKAKEVLLREMAQMTNQLPT